MQRKTWRRTELGKIVAAESGLQTGPFGSQLHARDYALDGVPVVMPRNLAGNVISTERIARVPAGKAEELERYRLRRGDVVLARRGRIGRCALVTADEDGWICGTGCLRVRPAVDVDSGYLIHYLQWPSTVAWMVENAVGQTMQNLNTRIVSELPLSFPPLSEQKRIAEVLSSVDVSITATRRLIRQTATVQRGFLRHILRHGVSNATQAHDTQQGAIPQGWELRRLGDLCTFVNGHGFKASDWSDHGLPIIRIKNLNGSRDFKYFRGDPRPDWIVDAGDLLFAWAGVRGVSFGPRIWPGPRGVLNQHIYRVRPRGQIAHAWLFETLRSVTRHIEQRAQGFKSSLLHVRKSDIADYRVPVPPYSEQFAIAERSAFCAEIETLEQSNLEGLIKLKNALMSDLFLAA